MNLAPYLLRLFEGIPDLKAVSKEINAPRDIAEKMVCAILEHGIFEPPFPEMKLDLAQQIGRAAVLQAQIDEVDDEKIELLRRWNLMVDGLMAQAQPSQPQGFPMGPEGMQVPPEAMPQPQGMPGMPPGMPPGPQGGGMPPELQALMSGGEPPMPGGGMPV